MSGGLLHPMSLFPTASAANLIPGAPVPWLFLASITLVRPTGPGHSADYIRAPCRLQGLCIGKHHVVSEPREVHQGVL